MRWNLSRKVSAALVAILVSTMVLTAVFGYTKFERVLSDQVGSRYSFVVFTTKKKIEDSLSLGLALRQLRQVQEMIEREKVGDPNILGIEIFDARGEILFDTDRGVIGGTVPPEWVAALAGPANHSFKLADEDTRIVGLPLVNSLGKVEGGIALVYPSAYLERELGGLLSELAVKWVAVLMLFALLAAVGSAILFRSVGRRLKTMEATLAKVMAEGGEAVPDPAMADAFEGRFAEFVGKTREAMDHVRDATDEVERLDRLA